MLITENSPSGAAALPLRTPTLFGPAAASAAAEASGERSIAEICAAARAISHLGSNRELTQHLERHGLQVQYVSWDDTARTKNSSVGPNILATRIVVKNFALSVMMPPQKPSAIQFIV